jgi:hypothetical protein
VRLHIELGGMSVRRFGLSIPDGLHVWVGSRGVHLYWHKSRYQRRVTFDRLEAS